MARMNKDSLTKREIVHMANRLFMENGFTATTAAALCKELGISNGNLTYYFPTKEHLLLELVKEMCAFQWDIIARERMQGISPLQAYALEITAQTALCDENEIARDFYVAGYTMPLTLAEIRRSDCAKAQTLFAAHNPDWDEKDYVLAENIASGIELSALMTVCDETVTLEDKIRTTLDSLLRLYHVPKEERDAVIREVLAADYRAIGRDILEKFIRYLEVVGDPLAPESVRAEWDAAVLS